MSTFNVHEWNRKRRLSALNEAEIDAQGNLIGFSGGDWKSKVREYDHIHFFISPNQADSLMDKLIMADIDMVDSYPHKGKYLLRVSLGSNAAADLAKAEKIVGQEAKKGSPENETDSSDMWGSDGWGLTNTDDRMNEGMGDRIAKWFGDGTIRIMDWAFFSIIADNEDAFKLLMETLETATNEEKIEMLTNLSNFRPKPTLRKLSQIELAKITDKQTQLKKAFRESTNEIELGRQGAVEIAREQSLHDLQDAIDKASEMGSINKAEKFAFDQLLVNAIKRRAKARGDI